MTALLTACGRRCKNPWTQGEPSSVVRRIVSSDGRRLCRICPLSASSKTLGFVSQSNLRQINGGRALSSFLPSTPPTQGRKSTPVKHPQRIYRCDTTAATAGGRLPVQSTHRL